MKKLLFICGLLWSAIASAQFTPGQLLTAQELNSQFSLYAPLAGATYTGSVTVPTLTVTGSFTIPASTVLPNGVTATEQGYLDNSSLVATDSFVKRSILASTGTIPISNVTGGVYNFQTTGSGAQIVVLASGGAISGVLTIAAAGSGYQVGDCLLMVGGNGDAILRVTSLSGSGVAGASVVYGGTGYTTGVQLSGMPLPPGSRDGVITGTLASNLTIIIPAGTYLQGSRRIVFNNNTTGAFTTTVKLSNGSGGSTGTGVVLPQGTNNSASSILYTDGVNDVWLANSALGIGAAPINNTGTTSAAGFETATTDSGVYYGLPGTLWQSQFHANWNVLQSQVAYNPTEWQIYTNSANGIAQTQNGTNQLILQSGTPFSTAWAGLNYFYFNGTQYKVVSVSGSNIFVQTPAGGVVTFGSTTNGTYYFAVTSVTSVVNVSGTSVTYVSGQPFIGIFDNGQVYINGTAYNATYNSPTSITLGTNLGTLTGATLNQYANINNELSVLRLQGLNGANEENFAITERPDGTYLQSLYAGQGQYRPIFFSTGETPAGTLTPMVSMYPAATLGNAGTLALGGNLSNQPLQITQNASNVDYLSVQGATAGGAVTMSTAGTDTNIPIQMSPKGTGAVKIASSGATLVLNDTSGSGFAQLNYFNNGSQYWGVVNNSSNNTWSLNRFIAGVFQDSPIAVSNAAGVVTFADAITPSQTAGIVGTTTNNNANAGSVGEYLSNTGSAVSLTSGSPTTVATITLTAGDWDVWGSAVYVPAGTTVISNEFIGINTSNALPASFTQEGSWSGTKTAGQGDIINVNPFRVTLTGSQTYDLVVQGAFSVSTCTASGIIQARRRR